MIEVGSVNGGSGNRLVDIVEVQLDETGNSIKMR